MVVISLTGRTAPSRDLAVIAEAEHEEPERKERPSKSSTTTGGHLSASTKSEWSEFFPVSGFAASSSAKVVTGALQQSERRYEHDESDHCRPAERETKGQLADTSIHLAARASGGGIQIANAGGGTSAATESSTSSGSRSGRRQKERQLGFDPSSRVDVGQFAGVKQEAEPFSPVKMRASVMPMSSRSPGKNRKQRWHDRARALAGARGAPVVPTDSPPTAGDIHSETSSTCSHDSQPQYFCEDCEKHFGSTQSCGGSATSKSRGHASKNNKAPSKACVANHFVRVISPKVGDHVFTSRLRVENLGSLFQFSTLSHLSEGTWLPPLPERHGIYIGFNKIVTFAYETESWCQDADRLSLQALTVEEFMQTADDGGTTFNRASSSLAETAGGLLGGAAAACTSNTFTSGTNKKLYLSHAGGEKSALLARALLGKRGFSLPFWTCWHVCEYVRNRCVEKPGRLPLRHYGSFALQDPVFPFGVLIPALQNAVASSSDAPEKNEWRKCKCKKPVAASTSGSGSSAIEVAPSACGTSSRKRKSGVAPRSANACHRVGRGGGGLEQARKKYECSGGHRFCTDCVEKHLLIRGVLAEHAANKLGVALCPHPLCYEVVEL